MITQTTDYLRPRECLREPIPELYWAASVLERAVEAHLVGNVEHADSLLASTNIEPIRRFIESLWGSAAKNPDQKNYLRVRAVDGLPPKAPRAKDRMPTAAVRREIIARDGYRCRFCGLWVIPVEVRKKLNSLYPDAVPWGAKNFEQHAAFQALWLQFDHVHPASFGGDSSLQNVVVTCGGCNYGKSSYHLDELGLIDPRLRGPVPTTWNGLTQLLDNEG